MASKYTTTANAERCDTTGQFKCPKCGAPMVPLKGKAAGKGWGCSMNRYDPRTRRATGCDGIIWNRSNFQQREQTPRAQDWPRIVKRTLEQAALRAALAVAPGTTLADGIPRARCLTVNAVPGSGKSTSMADDAEAIFQRVGASAVADWYMTAFNVNARASLETKLPALWPNVATINGFGGRLQGYNSRNYKPAKCGAIFRELVAEIEPKKRPSAAGVKAFAERMRDLLLYTDDSGAASFWSEALATCSVRFPALAKVMEKNADAIREYLPQVLVRALADRSVIDLTEQYCRPALEAIRATGWKQRPELCDRSHEWTADDLEHLARLIRAVRVPQVRGVIVDEAQDLSLSQIVLFLSATWRSGELILVGDDRHGQPDDDDYKAGQAIFGWRGAFPGSLALVSRLWEHLTGEKSQAFPLSVTFRCPPEICDAVRPLNRVMQSAKPRGSGEVFSVSAGQAFTRWLDIPERGKDGKPFTALWITRRNAPLAAMFLATLRERKQVCLRGGGDMVAAVDRALYEPAGYYDDAGEYRVSLKQCLAKLADIISENGGEGQEDADSMESFLLEVGSEVLRDPTILEQAELKPEATVGNLRRFVLYFASKSAPRVLSTVYRSKGDEAHLVIVDDCEALNTAWNGDADESAACRHVACTRSSESLLIVGALAGVICPTADADPGIDSLLTAPAPVVKRPRLAERFAEQCKADADDGYSRAAAAVAAGYGSDNPPPATVRPLSLPGLDADEPAPVKPRKPAAPRKPRGGKPSAGGGLFD